MVKKGEIFFFFHFLFFLLKRNKNDVHLQNIIQIRQKMKTGIQNVTMYPPSPFAFFAEMNLTTGSKNDAKFTEKHFAKKL